MTSEEGKMTWFRTYYATRARRLRIGVQFLNIRADLSSKIVPGRRPRLQLLEVEGVAAGQAHEGAVAGQQLVERPFLGHLAALQDENAIGDGRRAQAVRDEHD